MRAHLRALHKGKVAPGQILAPATNVLPLGHFCPDNNAGVGHLHSLLHHHRVCAFGDLGAGENARGGAWRQRVRRFTGGNPGRDRYRLILVKILFAQGVSVHRTVVRRRHVGRDIVVLGKHPAQGVGEGDGFNPADHGCFR